jgi:hypothetical protein
MQVASLLPLHNLYSILIRLLQPSSSEAGETWVRNMAADIRFESGQQDMYSRYVCTVTTVVLLTDGRSLQRISPNCTWAVKSNKTHSQDVVSVRSLYRRYAYL